MTDETQQPVFNVEKIYVKDLSIEVPNAPQCFFEQEAPTVEVQLKTTGNAVGDGLFDVALTITVATKVGEKTQFLVEVAQAGLFLIRNVPEAEIEPIVAVACPNILFPFAREAVADAVSRAGFPQLLLAPVNFENMYHQRLMAGQEQQAQNSGEVPIQ